MSENTLDKYLTPVTRPLKRSRSSPNLQDDAEVETAMAKVGDLTVADFGRLLDGKLAHLAMKEDLKDIANKVKVLEEENNKLNEEVKILKQNEKYIMGKLVDLEGRSRRNNLVFRGLKWAGNRPDY